MEKTKNEEEQQYLDLIKKILNTGTKKSNRTGVDTLSIFAPSGMKFTLYNEGKRTLPLLTTKKIDMSVVLKELLWFLRGDTDAKILNNQGVKIWDANTTKEFLEKRGLNYREGDIGPGYGWQWRHFNATYTGCDRKEGEEIGGVDQIAQIIRGLKEDPFGRRHILTAWNPLQLKEMALPPCHILYQLNVDPDVNGNPKYLSACMFQRSADVPLGVPFNIASYALLTHIISYITDLEPRELTIFTGDTHIYVNQIDGCKQQVTRIPSQFPYITIDTEKDINDPADLKIENIKLYDYNPQPFIKFPFAA